MTSFIPEQSWLWRRVLTFTTSAFLGLITAYSAWALAQANATASLLTLAICVIIWNAALQIVYLVAPTAEYMSKISELVRAARGDGAA